MDSLGYKSPETVWDLMLGGRGGKSEARQESGSKGNGATESDLRYPSVSSMESQPCSTPIQPNGLPEMQLLQAHVCSATAMDSDWSAKVAGGAPAPEQPTEPLVDNSHLSLITTPTSGTADEVGVRPLDSSAPGFNTCAMRLTANRGTVSDGQASLPEVIRADNTAVRQASQSESSSAAEIGASAGMVTSDFDGGMQSRVNITGPDLTEGGSSQAYTVALGTEPTATVTVSLDGNPYLGFSQSSFVFTSSTWSIPQTAMVAATNDGVVNGYHWSQIKATVLSMDPSYNLGPNGANCAVFIRDASGQSAVSDSAMTDEGMAVGIDVLRNDYDPQSYSLRISTFTQGGGGSVSLNPNSSFTYTPALGFTGTDSESVP